MSDRFLYWIWLFNTYLTKVVYINSGCKVTVILPYFSPVRIVHAKHMIRNLLRCDFVKEIIVTNQNPQLDIFDWITINDPRVELLNNNDIRHGSGYRWIVADKIDSEYFIVIDDDFLIYPRQLALLFKWLIEEPDIPHGLTGKQGVNGKYCRKMNTEVEIINQIYAVTRTHVKKFMEISNTVKKEYPHLFPVIEKWADDIVISMTGNNKPKIHNAGYNLRCHTAKKRGVALHQDKSFISDRLELKRALDNIQV